jgi:hypothetical protein
MPGKRNLSTRQRSYGPSPDRNLYHWPLDEERRQLPTAVGTAKTYLLLAAALATALLLANVGASPPST